MRSAYGGAPERFQRTACSTTPDHEVCVGCPGTLPADRMRCRPGMLPANCARCWCPYVAMLPVLGTSSLCPYLSLGTGTRLCVSRSIASCLYGSIPICTCLYLPTSVPVLIYTCLYPPIPILGCPALSLPICSCLYLPIYTSGSIPIYSSLYTALANPTFLCLPVPANTYLYLPLPVSTYLYWSRFNSTCLNLSLSIRIYTSLYIYTSPPIDLYLSLVIYTFLSIYTYSVSTCHSLSFYIYIYSS